MDIKRGDNADKTLAVPLSIYETGMRVYFAIKSQVKQYPKSALVLRMVAFQAEMLFRNQSSFSN